MQYTAFLLGAFASLLTGAAAQASQVPPPACLQACMDKVGNCKMCTSEGSPKVRSCVSSTCNYRDVSYAGAYFSSVCSSGGYKSYATNPPQFVQVPGKACNATAGKHKIGSREALVETTFVA